ncbi:MAG TPA: hypothetical protein DCO72_07440 [Ruminococcus sp.]|nr:hypothetical protein [Ruminococcus sp.]
MSKKLVLLDVIPDFSEVDNLTSRLLKIDEHMLALSSDVASCKVSAIGAEERWTAIRLKYQSRIAMFSPPLVNIALNLALDASMKQNSSASIQDLEKNNWKVLSMGGK